MATFKHISSKNADYGAAEQYLTFEHDEFTMKPTLDENGRLMLREDYRIATLNCGDEDFAVACIQRLPPIIRSTAAYAPPEVVDGKPPIYPYTPIKSSFEDAGSVEDMMLYTELEAAVHAMIQRLESGFCSALE